MKGLAVGLKSKIAIGTLVFWAGLAAGAGGQMLDTATFELSSFEEAEVWEYFSGEETLRAERRGTIVEVTLVGVDGTQRLPLLVCPVGGESRCSIGREEFEAQTRIRLLRDEAGSREELVLEDRGGRLTLVAGMVGTSRAGSPGRSHRAGEAGVETVAGEVRHAASREVLLRCPEGDSWMRMPVEEAQGSYYSCQWHGHQLEIAGGARTSPRQR